MPFVTPIVIKLFLSHASLADLIISLPGLALFFGIYLWASWRRARQLVTLSPAREAEVWLSIIALTALSVVLILINGKDWFVLFDFVCGYIAGRLATKRVLQVVGGLVFLIVGLGLVLHIGLFAIGQATFSVCAIGIISFSIIRSITTSWELHEAREEIARLAVTTERLRIARDLHDLLGHNLSLIALKSELARRLIKVAPERAIVEIGDVEAVARTTLQEVREAVASYRQPTLANELQSAREMLAAAGIAFHYESDERNKDALPTAIEAVVAWTIREGVTNIIRHSRAHQCCIRLRREQQGVQIEIVDDGSGAAQVATAQTLAPDRTVNGSRGNGLRGLTERVDMLGGTCGVGACADGGFRLVVSLPLIQRNSKPDLPASPVHNLSQAPDFAEKRGERA
ncbi:MAG TPA: sensor histidine kinase [Ktedonobacteraceae bacterium]|nr:sensor histidine kinase [Ktedonobacteraceae bacterium]